jgi:hypothetical protein
MPGGVSFNEQWDTEATATVRSYLEQFPVDNIFSGNLLWGILFDGEAPGGQGRLAEGRVRREEGGREITIPVEYNRNTNVTSFRGADPIPLNIDEVATMAHIQWCYYVSSVILLKTEGWENRGRAKIFDLLEVRTRNGMKTLKESLNSHTYSTGDGVSVGNAGKNIVGLQHLLSTNAASGTVWGIDRSVYSWWGHQYVAAGDTFANVGIAQLGTNLRLASGTNSEDPFHLWITTPTQFGLYEASVQGVQRVVTTKIGDRGFPTLEHSGLPIFHDSLVTAHTWYGLNMDYAVICLQEGVDFAVEQAVPPANQAISKIWQVFFSGQFGFERMDRQLRLVFTG